jgi:hypothetical protein
MEQHLAKGSFLLHLQSAITAGLYDENQSEYFLKYLFSKISAPVLNSHIYNMLIEMRFRGLS